MKYTAIRQRETAIHERSDDWSHGDESIRLHQYRCKMCGESMIWSVRPYDRCPHCGFQLYSYRRE